MRFRADTKQHPPPLHVELGPLAHIAPKRSCSKRPQLEPSVRRRGGAAWQGPKPRSCKQPGVGLEIRASKTRKGKNNERAEPQNPNPKLPKSEGSARASDASGHFLGFRAGSASGRRPPPCNSSGPLYSSQCNIKAESCGAGRPQFVVFLRQTRPKPSFYEGTVGFPMKNNLFTRQNQKTHFFNIPSPFS